MASQGLPALLAVAITSRGLYGNGIALATARHSIFDGNGNMFDACWLRKQGNSEIENTKIDLRQATIKIIQVTDSGTIDAIALVRPKNRLVNKLGVALKGVPLDEPGEPLRYRQKVALVSALQLNKSRTEALIDYNVEPIVHGSAQRLERLLLSLRSSGIGKPANIAPLSRNQIR